MVSSGDTERELAPPPDESQTTQPLVATESPAPAAKTEGLSPQAPAQPEGLPPQQKLSKFRHADAAVADENETTGGGNQLGRIPLVKVRRGRDGSKKPSTLARLLASF